MAANTQKPSTVSAAGWRSENWSHLMKQPAVIVNPEASLLEVLTWCHGEVRGIEDLVTGLVGTEDLKAGGLIELLYDRLEPVSTVMEGVIDRMVQGEPAHAKFGP